MDLFCSIAALFVGGCGVEPQPETDLFIPCLYPNSSLSSCCSAFFDLSSVWLVLHAGHGVENIHTN